MEKITVTKNLALIAAIFFCAYFVAGVALLLWYPVNFQNLSPGFEALPWQLNGIYLLYAALKTLPYAAIAFWNYAQKQITRNKALGTLIVTGVLYAVPLAAILRGFINIILKLYDTEVFACYSSMLSTYSQFSPLGTVGLILLCCSSAIELYAVTQKTGGTI